MKKLSIILVFAIPVLAAENAANANDKQGTQHPLKTPMSFDRDGNRQIEGSEIQALKKAFAGTADLKRFDADKNGQLNDAEITALNTKLGKLSKGPNNAAAKNKPPKAGKKKSARSGPSIGELALGEVKACDSNHDGKIMGAEIATLRTAYASNPKSWLYIYDENANKVLDAGDIAIINNALLASTQPLRAKTKANAKVPPKRKGAAKPGPIKL